MGLRPENRRGTAIGAGWLGGQREGIRVSRRKWLVLLLLVVLVGAYFIFDLGGYLSLEYFRSRQVAIQAYFDQHPWRTAAIFFGVYVAVTALSLPGAALMTLAAGAIFGLLWGTVVVSFASTAGATLAFLISRFLLRDAVESRFCETARSVNRGIEKDGAFYLFTLRLVPVFPFFVVNLVMGLTHMRTLTYMWVSQLGMLAGTLVYVNAGRQIGQLESLSGILSLPIILSFTLLGLFPLLARKVMDYVRAQRALRSWPRPARFDRDMVVIGAGAAGLVSAYIGAAARARVTLVERERMGGDCLYTGCVPSKALLRTAGFLKQIERCRDFGVSSASAEFDFAQVMERVQRVIERIEPHDSAERYTALGVECLRGQARILSPYQVRVGDRTLSTRSIVVATGARPLVPSIAGLDSVDFLTSETIWGLREQPRRLLVLGGGPIGCELAQAFARLGSQVTLVEMLPRLLIREDEEVSKLVAEALTADGVDLRLAHEAREFGRQEDGLWLRCDHGEQALRLVFDQVLVAVGRRPAIEGLGLEELGIGTTGAGTVEVNDFLQSRYPNILACGDVAGPYQFTHTAGHQAWYAAVNALFGGFHRFAVDYAVIPSATFTDPEVARVGLNEQEARRQGIDYEVTVYGLDDLDRAIADSEARGMVKVLTPPGKDRILGVTIVGAHASDLLAEPTLAMRHRLGLGKILGTVHPYPTFSEANKYVAGQWKRAHIPERVMRLLERYHGWRRGERSLAGVLLPGD